MAQIRRHGRSATAEEALVAGDLVSRGTGPLAVARADGEADGVAQHGAAAGQKVLVLEPPSVTTVRSGLVAGEAVSVGTPLSCLTAAAVPSARAAGAPVVAVSLVEADATATHLVVRLVDAEPQALALLDGGGVASGLVFFSAAGEPGMSVTVDGVAYVESATPDPSLGEWSHGASAADSAASFLAAAAADTRAAVPWLAVAGTDPGAVRLVRTTPGAAGNVSLTTDSAGACTVADTSGGVDAGGGGVVLVEHLVTAHELQDGGAVEVALPFAPKALQVSARASDGRLRLFSGPMEVLAGPDRVRITNDGVVDLVDGDVVTVWGAV